MGSGEGYGIAVECTRDSGLELETVGKAGMVLAGRGLSLQQTPTSLLREGTSSVEDFNTRLINRPISRLPNCVKNAHSHNLEMFTGYSFDKTGVIANGIVSVHQSSSQKGNLNSALQPLALLQFAFSSSSFA
ncbi:hypothetical protein Tco_0123058 [Tanacetum coccineum]